MTDEMIAAARQAYLALLDDRQITEVQLLKRLDEIRKDEPEILSALNPETDREALNLDNPANKSVDRYYVNRNKLEHLNFSSERIEYLIKVRETLRTKGVKGFTPISPDSVPSSRESASKMTIQYKPSDNLLQFVQKGDLPTIRTALRMELNDNSLTSADLEAVMAWAQRQVPGLFEPFAKKNSEQGMETDQKLWTSQYYNNQMVYLKTNFSAERFRHLIQVRGLLRQEGVKGFAPFPPVTSRSDSNMHTTANTRPDTSQTGNRRGTGTTGRATATQRSSFEWWHDSFRVILMIGCSLAAAVIVIILLLTNRNDQPAQPAAPHQAWQENRADTSSPVNRTSGQTGLLNPTIKPAQSELPDHSGNQDN